MNLYELISQNFQGFESNTILLTVLLLPFLIQKCRVDYTNLIKLKKYEHLSPFQTLRLSGKQFLFSCIQDVNRVTYVLVGHYAIMSISYPSQFLTWFFLTLVYSLEHISVLHSSSQAGSFPWLLPLSWFLYFILSCTHSHSWIEHFRTIIMCALTLYGFNSHKPSYSLFQYEEKSIDKVPIDIYSGTTWLKNLTFGWLSPLLHLSYKRTLKESDMVGVPSSLNSELIYSRFEMHWTKEKQKECPSLIRALFKTLDSSFYIALICKLINEIMFLVQPTIIGALISFVESPNEPLSYGIGCVLLLVTANFLQTFCNNHYFFIMFRLGLMSRVAMTTAIYRKSFVLSVQSKSKYGQGEITNLLSSDAKKIEYVFPYIPVYWSAPFNTIVAIYMLYQLLGVSMIAGVTIMVLATPFNFYMARYQSQIQSQTLKHKDARTKHLTEILNTIKVIKMFAWEKLFLEKVRGDREKELGALKKASYFRIVIVFFWYSMPLLVSMVTFTTFVLLGNQLTPKILFRALALFNILKYPLNMIPELISAASNARLSLSRLQTFLTSQEMSPYVQSNDVNTVSIKDGSFSWGESPTLQNINFEAQQGKLTAIVGKVGSGKTSILSALLGVIPKNKGNVNITGKLAYVSQDAWIMNAKLKRNITMSDAVNEVRYRETIITCELQRDLEILANGDETEIGQRGFNLSGGQKQRVNLARAVYSDADVYLLDDCLSALDAQVGQSIFENCICGTLEGKTRIFVTHNLQFLPQADCIVVMRDGKIVETGSYAELLEKKGDLHALMSEYAAKSEAMPLTESISLEGKKVNSPITASRSRTMSGGRIQMMSSSSTIRGSVSFTYFKSYLNAIGSPKLLFFLFFTFIIEALSKITTDWWLSNWSSQKQEETNSSYYLPIYFFLGGFTCFVVLLRAYMAYITTIGASRKLHDSMLTRLLRAPMQFFESTPTGSILGKFTKDQQIIDEDMPNTMSELITAILNTVNVVFIVSRVSPFSIAAMVPLTIVYRYVQRYYLYLSRDLRLLEESARIPILSLLSETLAGVTTIRAYQLQNEFVQMNSQRLDNASVVTFYNIANKRWLALRIEIIGTVIIASTALFATFERSFIGSSLVGLSIVYSLQMTHVLNWVVRMYSLFVTDTASLERVVSFTSLQESFEGIVPPEKWPFEGSIEFKDVELKYQYDSDPVLHNVNFEIKPKEKIGIVGRTGAGKSTLLVALFRLAEISKGSMKIDGIDISKIGLFELRSQLTMIPQDPILFEGTIRSNLDPFQRHSDKEVIKALKSVGLYSMIEKLPNSIETSTTECGQNFSTGQRQLFCMARALLRNTKILLLDEATASVDYETDQLIQMTIREHFEESTVLTIAHRLETIMDSDKVMVMDDGTVAEFDTPMNLLMNPESGFYSMYRSQKMRKKSLVL